MVSDNNASSTMAFFQRLLALAFLPVIALLISQTFYPSSVHSIQNALQPYISDVPLFRTMIANTLPSRSDIPLVVTAVPHFSHYEKVAKVAVGLAELGYPVIFITGAVFEADVKKLHSGITFKAIQGKPDKMTKEEYEEAATFAPGTVAQELYMMKRVIVDSIPDQHETLQQAFRGIQDQWGNNRPIFSLYDTAYAGHHPILLGSPGIKPDATLGLSFHPVFLDSNDTFPFWMGKQPAQGPNARAIHHEANQGKEMDYLTREMSKALRDKYQAVGVVDIPEWHMYHGFQAPPDHVMLLGVPEFEFSRSDLRPNVHYFGGLKSNKAPTVSEVDLPLWWDDVAAAKAAGKQIVAVSQGTVGTDLTYLLLPTLEALKDRTDVLIIATTVAVEVADIPDLVVPANTRIAKFVPYDLLLPQVLQPSAIIYKKRLTLLPRSIF
jgi:hypothetical protein